MRSTAWVSVLWLCLACGDDTSDAPKAPPSPTGSTPSGSGTPTSTPPSGAPATSTPATSSSGTPATTPGSSGTPPSSTPSSGSTPTPSATAPDAGPPRPDAGLALNECGLKTGWAGDEYCIKPPPPDKGFQIHIGPSNYANPEAEYLVTPGKDEVSTLTATSGNTSDIHYYYRQYRMRPGSHHVIISTGGVGGRRLGGTQNLAKDNPNNGMIPPENQGVGLPLPARSTVSVNMHYYNGTEKPILKEVWVNFWYKPPAEVKEPANEVFSITGVTAATAGSHVIVGASCPITQAGRILSLYGHRHYNNVRFSAWRVRGGQKALILDDYDATHPGVLEFNSLTKNPEPMEGLRSLAGWSGILDLMPGDKIDFECEIFNKTNKNFTGANEAQDDEMCILVGDSVGAKIPLACSALPARRL
jgi:hypothetical protein